MQVLQVLQLELVNVFPSGGLEVKGTFLSSSNKDDCAPSVELGLFPDFRALVEVGLYFLADFTPLSGCSLSPKVESSLIPIEGKGDRQRKDSFTTSSSFTVSPLKGGVSKRLPPRQHFTKFVYLLTRQQTPSALSRVPSQLRI